MVENRTKITLKAIKEFVHVFHFQNYKWAYILLLVIILPFSAIFFGDFNFYTFIIIFMILVILMIVLITLITSRRKKSLQRIVDNSFEYYFQFNPHEVNIVFIKEGINGESDLNYEIFNKVIETNNYFYFVLRKKEVYIVDKSGFAMIDDLKQLKELLVNKNIIIKRKKERG